MKYDFDKVIDRHGTFSSKWDGLANMKKRVKNINIDENTIPMMVADMDLQSPQPVIEAMHRVADHMMYGYTVAGADPRYAESLCRWFKDRHDWEVSPEQVVGSHGTFGALEHAVKMYSNEGDGVIVMRPVYGHFSSAIETEWNRKAVSNHLINNNGYYTIDFADLEEKCADPNNKVLIFCSPANPVGRVWTEEELKKVAEICAKHDVFVISDEVHCDHLRKGMKHIPFLKVCEDKSKAIVLVGINKSFNMAGLACSNAIIQDEELKAKFMVGYPFVMPTPFAVAGQIAAYTEGDEWMDQVCEYIEGNIDWAIDFFKQNMPKLKVAKPEGTYCLWLDFTDYGLSGEEVHDRIYINANVILQDGTVHDPEEGQCFQRMCLPCARSVLKEACERIAKAFEDVK